MTHLALQQRDEAGIDWDSVVASNRVNVSQRNQKHEDSVASLPEVQHRISTGHVSEVGCNNEVMELPEPERDVAFGTIAAISRRTTTRSTGTSAVERIRQSMTLAPRFDIARRYGPSSVSQPRRWDPVLDNRDDSIESLPDDTLEPTHQHGIDTVLTLWSDRDAPSVPSLVDSRRVSSASSEDAVDVFARPPEQMLPPPPPMYSFHPTAYGTPVSALRRSQGYDNASPTPWPAIKIEPPSSPRPTPQRFIKGARGNVVQGQGANMFLSPLRKPESMISSTEVLRQSLRKQLFAAIDSPPSFSGPLTPSHRVVW